MIRKISLWLVALVVALLVLPLAGTSGALAAAPSNDTFGGATAIGSLPYSDSIDVADAELRDATDPLNNCSGEDTRSVWYSFTPANTMYVDANTFGNDTDTTLAVYTGTSGNLSELACNDDTNSHQSQVRLLLTGGTTYYFMIAQYSEWDQTGFTFNLSETVNVVPSTGGYFIRTGQAYLSVDVYCTSEGMVTLSGTLTQVQRRSTVTGPVA